MGIDVHYVLRVHSGIGHGLTDRAGLTVLGGGGDVVGVRCHATAGHVRVHAGAAGTCVLLGLQHHDRGPLAEHEPVTVTVVRPRGVLRGVGTGGESTQVREGCHGQRMHAGLGASHHDHVGASSADHVQAHRDRLGTGGARGDGRVGTGLGTQLQLDVGGRGVGHQHRDREGVHPAGALLLHDVPLVQDRPHTADPGTDHDAQTGRIDLGGAGIGPGLTGGDHRVLARGVQLLGLRARQMIVGIDRHPAGEVDAQPVALDPVVLEGACGGGAGQCGLPGGGGVTAQRVDRAETGHGDAGAGSRHFDLRGSVQGGTVWAGERRRPGRELAVPGVERAQA